MHPLRELIIRNYSRQLIYVFKIHSCLHYLQVTKLKFCIRYQIFTWNIYLPINNVYAIISKGNIQETKHSYMNSNINNNKLQRNCSDRFKKNVNLAGLHCCTLYNRILVKGSGNLSFLNSFVLRDTAEITPILSFYV